MKPTSDPYVFIEEERKGYVRYQNTETGRRWEVYGECIGVAKCIVGATVDGKEIKTLKEAKEIWKNRKELFPADNPITPEFRDCCHFDFVELDNGND